MFVVAVVVLVVLQLRFLLRYSGTCVKYENAITFMMNNNSDDGFYVYGWRATTLEATSASASASEASNQPSVVF